MQLDLRIRGVKDDVNEFVSKLYSSVPEKLVSVSKAYPQTRYDKNSKEIAVYVKISNN